MVGVTRAGDAEGRRACPSVRAPGPSGGSARERVSRVYDAPPKSRVRRVKSWSVAASSAGSTKALRVRIVSLHAKGCKAAQHHFVSRGAVTLLESLTRKAVAMRFS